MSIIIQTNLTKGESPMHKMYKPYFYGITVLALLATGYIMGKYPLNLSFVAIFLATFGMVLEIIMIKYSQNKAISLQGAITIFAITILSPSLALFVVVISFLMENIAMGIIKKDHAFNVSYKVIFNIVMRTICVVAGAYVWMYSIQYGAALAIILTTLTYNGLNMAILFTMIYLMTNDKSHLSLDGEALRQFYSYNYVSILVIAILYYGYVAYGMNALLVLSLFLMPVQTSLLSKTVEEEMKTSIFKDALTGLYNRASFNKALFDYLNIKAPFTIIFIDFNRFKRINDTYGHDCGDAVLIHFAKSITSTLRKSDRVYRYGGDEFALVVGEEYDTEGILKKLDAIKESLVVEYGEHEISYSFSIGSFHYDASYDSSVEEIINAASKKMEEDKKIMHEKDGLEGTYIDSRLVDEN